MTLPKLEALPFLEALSFWGSKTKLGPKAFAALSDRAKVLAFGVARIAQGDELNTVYGLLDRAVRDGITFKDFQAGAGDIFARRGWSGKQAWKVDSIFRTNVQSAYNAGQYQALMRNLDVFPYWQYVAIKDDRTRPPHKEMGGGDTGQGKVYPVNHPVWDTWFPPNGHSCRCSVIGLTEEQVVSRGLTVETDDPTGQDIPVYDDDGEQTGTTVLQPDKGFAVNPGQVWLETIGQYANDKISSYPDLLAQAVLADLITNEDMALLLSGEQITQEAF